MLIYGEFNVFRPDDAAGILKKGHQALTPLLSQRPVMFDKPEALTVVVENFGLAASHLRATAYLGTPSFLYTLLTKAQDAGTPLHFEAAFVVAEMLPESLRAELEQGFGVRVLQGHEQLELCHFDDTVLVNDVVILQSLADGLSLLAGDSLQDAFHHSVRQDDYRWGLLHRIVFAHPLDSLFSIPPAGGAFPNPLGDLLPGFPTDGGFETLDRSDHDVRATGVNGFMFSHGPSNRSVHEAAPGGMRGVSSLPGGVSGVLGSPFYANLLSGWLSNDAYPQLQRTNDLQANTSSVLKFVPAK